MQGRISQKMRLATMIVTREAKAPARTHHECERGSRFASNRISCNLPGSDPQQKGETP